MAQYSPSQKLDQFLLRLPDGMRDRLAAAARSNNRTVTAEMISRLQATLDAEKRKPAGRILVPKDTPPLSQDKVAEMINEIMKRRTPAVGEGDKADMPTVAELFEKRISEQLQGGFDQIAQQIGRLEKRLERLEGLHSPTAAPKGPLWPPSKVNPKKPRFIVKSKEGE